MADSDFFVRNGLIVSNQFVFYANATTQRVGINNNNPDASLTITGTANVSGNVRIGHIFTAAANAVLSGALQTISGNVNFDTNAMFFDSVNNRLVLGVLAPDATLAVNGTANVSGNVRIANTLTVVGAVALSNTLTGPGVTTNLDGFLIDCGTFA
jgi:hypothetical protein